MWCAVDFLCLSTGLFSRVSVIFGSQCEYLQLPFMPSSAAMQKKLKHLNSLPAPDLESHSLVDDSNECVVRSQGQKQACQVSAYAPIARET